MISKFLKQGMTGEEEDHSEASHNEMGKIAESQIV